MTSSKTLNNLLFYFSVFFLVASIGAFIYTEEDFGWNTFGGTDGLSLYGMIFTLIVLMGMKVKFIRKIYRKTLLFFNRIKFTYELSFVIDSNMDMKKLYRIFEKSLKQTSYFDEKEISVFNMDATLIRFNSEGMGATVTLKDQAMTSDYQEPGKLYVNRYKVEIKGKDDYKAFLENKSFILNIISEKLQEEHVRFNKFYLKIKKENLAYNMLNENYILLDKSSRVINSTTEFEKSYSLISVNKFDGISISSRNKGEFNLALELLEDILVS